MSDLSFNVEPLNHQVSKVIVWKRTSSSRSSTSRNPLIQTSKEDNDDESGSDFIEEFCMISGSHSSSLDRLYAWERKLYDEVKVKKKRGEDSMSVHVMLNEAYISFGFSAGE